MLEPICIQNIEYYNLNFVDGSLIITPKIKNVNKKRLFKYNLKKSSILKCLIKKNNEIISTNKTYRSILIDIYKTMPINKIIKNTQFNFKSTNENGEKGYYWCDEINMSFQNKDSTGTLKEIINMVNLDNMTIDITIKLNEGIIINFNNQ